MCQIIPLQLLHYIALSYMHKYFNVVNLQLQKEVLLIFFFSE